MTTLAKNTIFFPSLFLFFSGWGVLALLLAWGGVFYGTLFILYGITFLSVSLFVYQSSLISHISYLISQHPTKIFTGRWSLVVGYVFLFCLSIFLASFLSPSTFFSGRDEGSIFEASYELAQTHALTFSSPESRAFFEIYGQGRALNYPGFYYTGDGSLTTQFPTAYIAWLASFISLFGLSGIILANAILLFLFFLAFGAIIQTFASQRWVIIGILLAVTSFPIFWFSRFTLTENFALAFVWVFVLATYQLTAHPKRSNLALFLLSGTLVLFGRIEGFAFIGIALIVLFLNNRPRIFLLSNARKYILLPALFLGLLIVLSFSVNTPFYATIAKGFLRGSLETASGFSLFFSSLVDRWNIFFLYGIGASLLIGLLGIVLLVKQKFSPKILTLSVVIVSPSLLYLFVSFISPDHPWMLRRFMFSVIPLTLLLSIFVCARLFELRKKYLGGALAVFLLLAHLPAFIYFFPLTQGKDLLTFTQTFSQHIPDSELLLIDQLASGDGFRMFPGALGTLFGKHAVYFMNPYDLDELDLSQFSSISLLVPEGREGIYTPILAEHNAEKIFSLPLSVSTLEHSSLSSGQFPEFITIKQNVILYRWTASL